MQFVLDNIDEDWNWEALSKNQGITIRDILDNPTLSWDYKGLSRNPNITMKIVFDNPDKPWDYGVLSTNKVDKDYQIYLENKLKEYGF